MTAHPPRLRFGVFEIDVKAGELWKHGRRIRLQEQPYRVLLALLEVPGETVTRQELRERLWPAETFVDFDNGLNNVINRLRSALGDSATSPKLIETVGRRGYRFIGELATPLVTLDMPDLERAESHAPEAGHAHGHEPADTAAHPHIDIHASDDHAPEDRDAPAHDSSHDPSIEVHPAVVADRPWSATRWGLIGAAVAGGLLVVASAVGLAPTRVGAWLGGTTLSASPGIRSLGILPLADPAESSDDLFAYGMVNAVISQLNRFQQLNVVSPTSEEAFQDQPARSPRELARELGVDTLLRGTVTRNDEHIGVNLELIDGASGQPLWNQSFTRPASELLALRSDVVRDVVDEVQARLTPTLEQPQPESVTANAKAYEAYLRGKFETLRRNPAAFRRAVSHFTHALALDPDYAPAHAGLAWTRLQQSGWAGEDHPRRHVDDVRAAIATALALDPNLAEAHIALAMAYRLHNWDWSGAEAAIKRAIQLKPSSAMAHNEYLRLLLSLGRFPEALTEAQKTLALDPHAAVYWLNEGIVLYTLRRLDEAEARFQRALELEPSFSSANRRLVRLYLVQGRIPEARAALERLEAQPTRISARALRAHVEAEAGNAATARRMLAALDGNVRMRHASTVAAAHLALGDRAAALAALRQGITERAIQPLSLAAPELDALRADADFAQLLTEMRLPTGSIGALVAVVQQNASAGTTPLPALASAEAAQ